MIKALLYPKTNLSLTIIGWGEYQMLVQELRQRVNF